MTFRTRDILLILGLILILLFSPYLKNIQILLPPINIPYISSVNNDYNEPQTEMSVNESQGQVPDTGTQRGLSRCDRACVTFCDSRPNTPFIPWEEITPRGSTKNCKTILEEELGVADLITCEECKCV